MLERELLVGIESKSYERFFRFFIQPEERFRGYRERQTQDPAPILSEGEDQRQMQTGADEGAHQKFNTFQVLLQVFGFLGPLGGYGKEIGHRTFAKPLQLIHNPPDVLNPFARYKPSGSLQTSTGQG